MPFDSNGDYVPPTPPVFPAVEGEVIRADYFNQVIEDLAAALSLCIKRDGGSQIIAALDFGGTRLKNIADAVEDEDAVSKQQLAAEIASEVTAPLATLETSIAATDAKTGLFSKARVTVTGSGTLSTDAIRGTVLLNKSSAFTLDLMSAASVPAGARINFVNINTGAATLDPAGTQTIRLNGAAVSTLVVAEAGLVLLESNGVDGWDIVGSCPGVGGGATRVDVTASRAFATQYTNTKAYAIDVYITVRGDGGSTAGEVRVEGLLGGSVTSSMRCSDSNGTLSSDHDWTMYLRVPPQMTYELTDVGSEAAVITRWIEVS